MEQHKLDRAFDLLEWSLGMSARYLMDPYCALAPSAGCGDDQRETWKELKERLTDCCKIITPTVPCDVFD